MEEDELDEDLEAELEPDLEDSSNNEIKKKTRTNKKDSHKKSLKQENEGFLKHSFGIIKNDKKFFLWLFVGFLVVYSFLYGLWKIPFIGFGINRMSSVGLVDYFFILGVSAFVSLLFTLVSYERNQYHTNSNKVLGTTGGGFAAFVAGICPACQGIALVALGSTLLTIPTAFLVPYLGVLKTLSLGLLVLAVYVKADSIYTKTCPACLTSPENTNKKEEPFLFRNNYFFGAIVVLVTLIFINQLMIPNAFASLSIGSFGTINFGNFEYGSKITLKPMPLSVSEQAKIPGYKTKVKSLPTISELSITPSTGDVVQDLLNNVIPKGTPFYGAEAGVNFDDPIGSQKNWAKGRAIQLDAVQEERWNRIANSFTCDYCCGSPQNPTIITRCGCAHAAAAQGMAKWFIKYYGSSYSDEEIYGEMARWYALWYPKGTIERIILEAQ
ncbi:MAG: hypothetical protein AABW90_03250 [Nanoarchaeota archaeon]